MTPYQLKVCATAYSEAQGTDADNAMWLAWHVGAFSRVDRLPRLEDVLRRTKPEPKKLVGSAPPDKVGRDLMAALMGLPSVVKTAPKAEGASPAAPATP